MKRIPSYNGTLRSHFLNVPRCIYDCSGILIFGKRIKSLVFSTDVAIIKNINTDAVIAVYPFTPQSQIAKALIETADVPVFVGVGGGTTSGNRSVLLSIEAEHLGAHGVVVNAPVATEVITKIKSMVDIPVIATIASARQDVAERIEAGADILNVAVATETPAVVGVIRSRFSDIPIIATGGPTEETIRATIEAGANAITYTPPTNGQLFAEKMKAYRNKWLDEADQ